VTVALGAPEIGICKPVSRAAFTVIPVSPAAMSSRHAVVDKCSQILTDASEVSWRLSLA
jgi:hypothetical protein